MVLFLGVKRAVKYINEFLAPALCNQVNKGSDLRGGVEEDDDGDCRDSL